MDRHMIVMFSPVDSPQTQRVTEKIKDCYPGYYPADDGKTFFVRTPDVTELVARKIGLLEHGEQDDPATGLVVRLNGAYSGLARHGMWEWLEHPA